MITRKCISFQSSLISITARTSNSFHLRNAQKQLFSTFRHLSAYSDTVSNLKIGEHTRVIFQGYTGKQVNLPSLLLPSSDTNHKATQNAKQSIEYGTKIVGGVTPGKNGEHLGLPVLPSVRAVSETFSPPF